MQPLSRCVVTGSLRRISSVGVSDLPSYDQIAQLPSGEEHAVTPDLIDLNGHMNIRHYFDAASLDLWRICIAADTEWSTFEERGLSLFTVEQHLRYVSELRTGDTFVVHGRLLERSDRVVHAMSFVVTPEAQKLACTFEASYVHVDTSTRRSVPIPDDLAARFDAQIAASEALGWAAPVSGAMGIRRR